MNREYGNRKIKVAYFLTPIDFGGAERVSLNFLKNFNADKFEIVPILLTRPWEEKKYFEKEISKKGLKYHTIPVARRPAKEGRDHFRVVRCCRMLLALLKQERFDLIHTHGYFTDILGVIAAKVARVPHVSTCHGFIQSDKKLKLYNFLDVFLLKYSNRIIAVSDDIKVQLIESGISKDKIETITNAVVVPRLEGNDTEKKHLFLKKYYNAKKGQVVIGYVGRLSAEKGLKYLLKSVLDLKEKSLFFKIILIGDGPERKNLMDLVQKNHLQQDVVFAGFLEDPGSLLPLFDVFVLPSLTEGTPMAMLEAMSCGLPVIASRVGGVPDVISDNVDGMLVSPGDSLSLAKSILVLSRDQRLRMSMSNNARKKIIDNYSISPWCRKIESLYFSAASGGRDIQNVACEERIVHEKS